LDEVQKEPQLVESIKSVYDQFPEPRYILLGSSQILLLKKIRESLAGRCQIVEMYPLTLPEMLTDSWESEIQPSYFQNLISNNPIKLTSFLLDSEHPKKNSFLILTCNLEGILPYPILQYRMKKKRTG